MQPSMSKIGKKITTTNTDTNIGGTINEYNKMEEI